jgi:hypothetical protein
VSTPQTVEPVRYGNLRNPRRPGVAGLSLAATVLAGFSALAVVTSMMTFNLATAGVVLVVALVVIAPLVQTDREGRIGYQRIVARLRHRRAAKAGRTTYVAGPASHGTPDGRTRLPGLAAATELLEGHDVYGAPFAVLHTKATDHYSVVFQGEADGDDLVDQAVTDAQVAHWGGWLARLGQEADVAAASVTVETAPDPGTRLTRMIRGHTQPGAPEFAAATLDEIVASYPSASSIITTRIAMTFTGKARSDESKRSPAEMLEYLARVVPGYRNHLRVTGAGTSVRMMSAADLTDAIRVCFDPSVSQLVDEQRAENPGGTGLTWSEAGPAFAQEFPDRYAHDGAFSMVWQMRQPPTGVFTDSVLKALLAPHPDIARKRVTIIYRPESAEAAATIVERDVRDANTIMTGKARAQHRDSSALRAANKAASEEAEGAGLVRFGMIVTATVTSEAALQRAASTINQLSAPVKLRLRLARHNQAAAFAAGLPLGLVLPAHLLLPDMLRDAL